MVVPWIGYIIWKYWVIHVLVFLVFHLFNTAELISIAKTVNLAVWAFSSNFLHDFTLFAIDMNYIYHILPIATTFGALSNMTFLGQKCIPILGMRLTWFQCLKKIIVGAHGSQIRHLWPRWPSPNVLACLNLNLTQGHPLVAKFTNMCHFRHCLRVSRKTWPKSTGLQWKI